MMTITATSPAPNPTLLDAEDPVSLLIYQPAELPAPPLPPPVSAHLALPTAVVYAPPSIAVDMVAAFLAGRKPTTLRAYAQDLEDFAGFLGHATPGPAVELLLAG